MNIVGKVDSQGLEILAVSFATGFLKDVGENTQKTINLHGHNPEILILIQNRMDRYFRENHVDVLVGLGRDGYVIDVGYFLRSSRNLPNRCQYL